MMKYLFQALLLGYFTAALANSNLPTKPPTEDSQCTVKNNYFIAGSNSKKIENMFSEIKQELAEIKQEIREMKENQTGGPGGKVYKNCAEVYKSGDKISGVYKIDPDGLGEFEVFCDQKTAGGGWTVFQKRRDGSVDFFRAWDDYKRGFGNLNGEFWLGLDKIHRLTVSSSNKLRVDLEDIHGKTAFAEYSSFSVASGRAKYQLNLGSYSGTAGDSLAYHRGSAFSTKDRDNDVDSSRHCALVYKGGWWYNACHYVNLNGFYLNGKNDDRGMRWLHWKNNSESVKRSEMKIRPKDF
ncbi:microfibril-associated glycoprotein 4-like [Oculina patagonica]